MLVLEPALPGGALKTARKGCGEFELTVHGVAAHAGVDPGKGASAIHELADQIAAIERLQDLDARDQRQRRRRVGRDAGRTSSPPRRGRLIDVRAPTAWTPTRVEAALRALQPRRPGARLNIRGGFERPPLERTPAVGRLFSLRVATWPPPSDASCSKGSTGGGSDGNFTAAIGVPTLDGLGAVGDGAHAAHEHVDIDASAWRAALMAGLLQRSPGSWTATD